MARTSRRTGAVLVAVLAVLGAAGCSEAGEPVRSDASTATTSTATATPTPSTPSADPSSATSTPTGDAPDGVRTTVALAPGLSGEAQAAGEAFGVFQRFVGASFASPPMDETASADVIVGEALRDDIASATRQRAADGLATRGTQAVTVRSVRVSGTDATVCAAVLDDTYEISTAGGPTRPASGETRTYRASMTTDGTTWRTVATEIVDGC